MAYRASYPRIHLPPSLCLTLACAHMCIRAAFHGPYIKLLSRLAASEAGEKLRELAAVTEKEEVGDWPGKCSAATVYQCMLRSPLHGL